MAHRPLRALGSLLARLRRGVLSEDDASELLTALRVATEVDAIIVGQEWGRFGGFFRSDGVPADWPETYQRLQHQDPAWAYLSSRPYGSWFLVRSDSSADELETELHRTFLARGFSDAAITLLHSAGAPIALVLYRRNDQAFDEEDRALLELLYPHLRRAFGRARSARAWAGEFKDERERSLRDIPHVSIRYPSGEVHWARPAIELFERRLNVPFRRQQERLEKMLRHAVAIDQGAPVPLVGDLCGEVLFLCHDNGTTREAVVLLQRAEEPSLIDGALAPAEELLSPRQRKVARLAAAGSSLPEVASELGMGTETARSHLKAVYERLCVTERSSLSHLLR